MENIFHIFESIDCEIAKEHLTDYVNSNQDINITNDNNQSLLHLSCLHGTSYLFDIVIDAKINLSIIDNFGNAAIHFAVIGQNTEILSKLSDLDPACLVAKNQNGQTPLHIACKLNKDRAAQHLIENVNDLDVSDKFQFTPLHYAANEGHLSITRALVRAGAHLHALSSLMHTALHMAASQGHLSLVEFFVQAGANVNARSKTDLTPFHMAASHGHLAVCSLLLEAKANASALTLEHQSALHLAAHFGHNKIVAFICRKFPAQLHYVDKAGCTPFLLTAKKGHIETAKILLSFGVKVNQLDKEKRNVLEIAKRNARDNFIKAISVYSPVRSLEAYPINSEYPGCAIIINNTKFSAATSVSPLSSRNRIASKHDGSALREFLHSELHFDVTNHENLTSHEMRAALHAFQRLDVTQRASLLLVFIMSHGNSHGLYGSDCRSVSFSEIQSIFNCKHRDANDAIVAPDGEGGRRYHHSQQEQQQQQHHQVSSQSSNDSSTSNSQSEMPFFNQQLQKQPQQQQQRYQQPIAFFFICCRHHRDTNNNNTTNNTGQQQQLLISSNKNYNYLPSYRDYYDDGNANYVIISGDNEVREATRAAGRHQKTANWMRQLPLSHAYTHEHEQEFIKHTAATAEMEEEILFRNVIEPCPDSSSNSSCGGEFDTSSVVEESATTTTTLIRKTAGARATTAENNLIGGCSSETAGEERDATGIAESDENDENDENNVDDDDDEYDTHTLTSRRANRERAEPSQQHGSSPLTPDWLVVYSTRRGAADFSRVGEVEAGTGTGLVGSLFVQDFLRLSRLYCITHPLEDIVRMIGQKRCHQSKLQPKEKQSQQRNTMRQKSGLSNTMETEEEQPPSLASSPHQMPEVDATRLKRKFYLCAGLEVPPAN